MNKYILWLVLFPILGKAQSHSSTKANLSLISSLEIGGATINTNVLEIALLAGLKDNNEFSTLEIGYVYKRLFGGSIGHFPHYHGLRGAIEVMLLGAFGTYGTYDVIAGKRWLYEDEFDSELKVFNKIHGEGTIGVFLAPKSSRLKFYAGIEPQHYDPLKIREHLTPHKSISINLKVKYTIDL